MDDRALPSTDHGTVWLAGLIEAAEGVAATNKLCDPDTVKAFSDRLACRPLPGCVFRAKKTPQV